MDNVEYHLVYDYYNCSSDSKNVIFYIKTNLEYFIREISMRFSIHKEISCLADFDENSGRHTLMVFI